MVWVLLSPQGKRSLQINEKLFWWNISILMDVPFSAMTTSPFIRHECSLKTMSILCHNSISDQFISSGKYKSHQGPSRSLSTSFNLVNNARPINHFHVHFGAYKSLSSASRITDSISRRTLFTSTDNLQKPVS